MRSLERITNVAVILAVVFFCTTVVKDYWIKRAPPSGQGAISQADRFRGKQLSLPEVNWSRSNKTLVLAISTQCHFCVESIPFYRKLSATTAVKLGKVNIVAVLPQEMPMAESFIKDSDIHANKVVSLDLSRIGVSGTPTVFLVDRSGSIENAWIGELSATQQHELFSQLES